MSKHHDTTSCPFYNYALDRTAESFHYSTLKDFNQEAVIVQSYMNVNLNYRRDKQNDPKYRTNLANVGNQFEIVDFQGEGTC